MDIFNTDILRHMKIRRREIPDRPDAAGRHPIRNLRRRAFGNRQHRNPHIMLARKILQLPNIHHWHVIYLLPDNIRIIVKYTDGNKSPLLEIGKLRQRLADISSSNYNHILNLIQTQNLADLFIEIFYIVTISLLAKSAEIIQILTNLRSCHMHPSAELIRRNPLHSCFHQLIQIPVIPGQPLDNSTRNTFLFHPFTFLFSCHLTLFIIITFCFFYVKY